MGHGPCSLRLGLRDLSKVVQTFQANGMVRTQLPLTSSAFPFLSWTSLEGRAEDPREGTLVASVWPSAKLWALGG